MAGSWRPARLAVARNVFAPLLLGAAAFSGNPAAAATYNIVELGTLTQGTSTVVRGPNLTGTAVAGGRLTQPGRPVAPPGPVVFASGGSGSVGAPAGTEHARLLGVNDTGAVVGAANIGVNLRAYAGTLAGLNSQLSPLPGDTASAAYAINNPGQSVGYSSGPSGERAVRWTAAGLATALAAPSGRPARAYAINDRGDVVGVAGNAGARRPVIWSSSGVADELAVLPGFTAGEAAWVSNRGDVVGYSTTDAEVRHATLWAAAGTPADLGTLPGGNASQAFGINEGGTVVGSSESTEGTRAFIWRRGEGMQDLNALVAASSLVLTKAIGINNAGVIAALGHDHDPTEAGGDGHDHERPMRVVLLVPAGG